MAWRDSIAKANASKLAVRGETARFEQPPAAAYDVRVVRLARDPLEGDGLTAFARLWSTVGQFQSPPLKGDRVTLSGVEFVVHAVKADDDPASDGVRLYVGAR